MRKLLAVLLTLSIVLWPLPAWADSEGPNTTGTAINDAAVGVYAWSNPGNATADDGSRATAAGDDNDSNYLKATNFGFTLTGCSTVDGILVEYETSVATNSLDLSVILAQIFDTAAYIGDINSTADITQTTDDFEILGGAADDWVAGISCSEATNAAFGVGAQHRETDVASGANQTLRVDFVRMTITFSTGGGTPGRRVIRSETRESKPESVRIPSWRAGEN